MAKNTVKGVAVPPAADHSSRPALERLSALAPWLVLRGAALFTRLPPSSRLRRRALQDLAGRGFAGVNRRDPWLPLLLYEPDTEIYPAPEWQAVGLADCYRGIEGWRDVTDAIEEYLPDLRYAPERLIDLGDRFVLRLGLSAGGKASGAPTDQTVGFVYHFSPRGRVTRQDCYWTWEQALAAEGLREDAG
jgi:hypothetical protein